MSLRKSLRKSSSRSSIFYLESYEMKQKPFHIGSDEVSDKETQSKVELRANEHVIPIRAIDGAILFALSSNRRTGTVGQIVLTCRRITFIPYRATSVESNVDHHNDYKRVRYPPFESDAVVIKDKDEDDSRQTHVDYANVFDILCKNTVLVLYLADFRCIEVQLKHSIWVKQLAAQLERFTPRSLGRNSIESSLNTAWLPSSSTSAALSPTAAVMTTSVRSTPCTDYHHDPAAVEKALLWQLLARQFPYNYPAAWCESDSHWFKNNRLLRISQANENRQMCKTLPCTFVTLRSYLTDVNLLHEVSNRIKGQRVPVVSYSNYRVGSSDESSRSKVHVVMRSGMLDKELTYSIMQAISPIQIFQTSKLMYDTTHVMSVYGKLRHVCFPYSSATRFFSHVGRWLKVVGKCLAVADNCCKIVADESSILLMEHDDNRWNVVLSCLIQILSDRKRRTVAGFNALLAKEWVHLNGLSARDLEPPSSTTLHVLFVLFLDCVHQIRSQYPNSFQFTSLYLIRVFDLACNYSQASSSSTSNDESLLLADLNVNQLLFFYNPNYDDCSLDVQLKVNSQITCLQFWRPFYLRWFVVQPSIDYYNQFDCCEMFYFRQLKTSSSDQESIVLCNSVDQCSIQDDDENNLNSDYSLNQF
jgi:hypothetical protein